MRLRLTGTAFALLACAAPTRPTPELNAIASVEVVHDEAPSELRLADIEGTRTPPHTSPVAIRLPVDVERAIDDAVFAAIDARQLPGAVIAIGRRDGLAFLRDYGARAIDPEIEPNDIDTIYDLASLTKPIATATALAILADRGLLSFDDPVARFIPVFAAGGKERITIRQLLEHTGGLPSVDSLRDYEEETREESLARIFAIRPVHPPGQRVLYSDLGFIVLGETVARVANEPLDAFVAREILGPLEMRSSSFRPSDEWIPRIAPTERAERRLGVMIRGEVHDPRAFRLGGVAGNAGLFASAPDLARFARAMLGGGELEGHRILRAERVQELITGRRLPGGFENGLGWDMRSRPEARRARGMSETSYGHLGWTGTSIRIDPRHDVFVIVLSNDVHPNGQGDVRPLATTLERIVASAAERILPAPRSDVRAGIDVEARDGFPRLRARRVALVTHDAARARDGRRTLDVLVRGGVDIRRVLAPEHGLDTTREGHIRDGRDHRTGLPVFGLFGPTRRPNDTMLADIDTVVIDLVDVGARFYTYASTMHETLVAAAARPGLQVVILDRPNPLGGALVEGPMRDPELRSFVNYHPLPLRHGLTLGELARLLDSELELGLGERLDVVQVEGWERASTAVDIGPRWNPPSPNLPNTDSVLLYPALALLEGTDVSVGRGTSEPFSVLGAPWASAERILEVLSGLDVPGVEFQAARFRPRSARHRGRVCHGVRVRIINANDYRATRTGLAVVRAMLTVHRERIALDRVLPLLGSRQMLDALVNGSSLDELVSLASADATSFETRRAPFLLY